MAKILVADDNSNVQKTVTLALAELGVEVVSVNNGEAAVRKLSDFIPDLILADIFMPVRNGYEVCEYVKKDSRFSRVPVVLLVGAFDPLDEREAQRVGADGILKKPFVPPEPLITMVKTLLDRTLGERLVAVTASKPAVAIQAKSAGSAIAEVHAAAPETDEEPLSQEFSAPAERIEFGEGDHPVAFGMLLETPVQDVAASNPAAVEPVEDEQILTSARDATLGDPIFWKNDSQEPESEAEPAEEASSGLAMRTWKQSEDSLPRRDEALLLHPIEPLELVRDEQEGAPESVVDSGSILLDQAAQAPLTVESDKAEDLAANPIEWMSTAPLEHSDEAAIETPGWDEPIPDAVETIDSLESSDHPQVSVEASAPVLTTASAQPDELVAKKIPVPDLPAAAASEPPAPVLEKTHIALSPLAQSAADTARSISKQDWADLAAILPSSATELAARQIGSEGAHTVKVSVAPSEASRTALTIPAQETSPDPALVEAVVQRVLDKMRPQVVDIITKEFLRPIVQALVHREIEKH